MKVRCDYCDSYIPDTAVKCPQCGATNAHLVRNADAVPKTIRQLQDFCAAHHMPLEKMRFFIGEDHKAPRAFGIYQDRNGDFVVYKNKDNGSRAIRYRGKDEAYAVNELYLKLKSEVTLRRTTDMRSTPQPTGSSFTRHSPVRKTARRMGCVYILIIFITMLMLQSTFLGMRNRVRAPLRGYYSYQDENYFYNSGSWYSYNDLTGSWDDATAADELIDHSDRYWRSNRPDPGLNPHPEQSTAVSDTSSSYESSSSWEDDWDDSDWDYDYSSWDSSDTDWSSDW